tara:strand:- start:215 stop:496 length:282 start_codon:yes stop_codon:yes gene_type:complete
MSSTHTLTGSMQDARFLTDYSPGCQKNLEISKTANIDSWNSTDYRNYLQKNGLVLLQKSYQSPCGKMKCTDHGLSTENPPMSMSPAYTDDPEL